MDCKRSTLGLVCVAYMANHLQDCQTRSQVAIGQNLWMQLESYCNVWDGITDGRLILMSVADTVELCDLLFGVLDAD